MSLESDIKTVLNSLVGNRVYPDVAPANVVKPFIVWQQVGGEAVNFMDPTIPSKRNARIQISVWATTRLSASDISRQAEDAMRAAALNTTVLGAGVATYETETGLYGMRQDFSIWH